MEKAASTIRFYPIHWTRLVPNITVCEHLQIRLSFHNGIIYRFRATLSLSLTLLRISLPRHLPSIHNHIFAFLSRKSRENAHSLELVCEQDRSYYAANFLTDPSWRLHLINPYASTNAVRWLDMPFPPIDHRASICVAFKGG